MKETKEKKVVKKLVKRSMKKLINYTSNDDIYYQLMIIVDKVSPDNVESSKIDNELSERDCKKVRKKLLKKISKQLKKEHTFLVIARLIIAYLLLDGKKELLPKSKNIKSCMTVYELLTNECFSGSDKEILKVFEELDRLTK